MDKLVQIAQLLITFASSIYITIVMVRFLLQLVRADFHNPLSQFIVTATSPILMPLRKIIPGFFGVDMSCIVLALALQILTLELLSLVLGRGFAPLLPVFLYSIQELIILLLNIYLFSFIVIVIVSWIAPNGHNPAVALLTSITEPVLRPIRNVLPPMGGLDFSIMAAILLIYILKILMA